MYDKHTDLELYIRYFFLFLFQLCFLIQLYYLLVIQRRFSVYKIKAETAAESQPVSVIICARNESRNLQKNLASVLAQKYGDFEVVVVNDCSSDDSEDVLRVFEKQYANLKVLKIEEHPRFKTAKKFAATLGIKAAANELLVFTDADCEPDSPFWLSRMAAHYQNPGTEIVLAYSPYLEKEGFLNKLIRYETFQTALNYLSYALSGMPYMGVGRNLSYKKSLFFKGKGFAAHMHIPSGDDDLFVNQNATASNTVIEVSAASHTWSQPEQTWSAYWNQKARHLGAGNVYKKQHRVNLFLQVGSATGFYIFFIVCLFLKVELIIVGIIFLFRLSMQILVFYKPMELLRNKDLIWWFILLDPFYYIYLIALSFVGLFRKKVAWK